MTDGDGMKQLIYLRREVVWSPAKCPCCIWAVLCKSKVGNLDVAIKTKEDVLGLEITINNVLVVKVVKRQCHLGGVKFCNRVREALHEMAQG